MKYKVGDRVKIRTWEDMENEYGERENGIIQPHKNKHAFLKKMEEEINKNNPDRILTIEKIPKSCRLKAYKNACYIMEESERIWHWQDWMIEGLAKEPIPITNRFEIMDL